MAERVVARIGEHKPCVAWATWNWHFNRGPRGRRDVAK